MHAGYTASQHRERRVKIREDRRIDEESKAARDYLPITAGDFVLRGRGVAGNRDDRKGGRPRTQPFPW